VRRRQVQLDKDPMKSVRTETCQTVRMTIRAGIPGERGRKAKRTGVGPNDLVIPSGRVITYRTKGTLGITG